MNLITTVFLCCMTLVVASCSKKSGDSVDETPTTTVADTNDIEENQTGAQGEPASKANITPEEIAALEDMMSDTSSDVESDVDFPGLSAIDVVSGVSLEIHWDQVADVSRYIIIQSTDGQDSVIDVAESNQSSYVVTGLSPNTSYSFKVRILDTSGRIDSNNVVVTATTATFYPPTIISASISPGVHRMTSSQDQIIITLNFDYDITINDSPRIPITIGDRTVYALYNAGDGTDTITFAYDVESDDMDVDGISVGSIDLTSGSLDGPGGSLSSGSLSIDGSASLVVPNSTRLWLDAMQSNSLDLTGTSVNTWNDRSLNSYSVSAASGEEPFFLSDDGDGRPGIDFSLGSKYLRGSAVISGSVARHVFIVARPYSLGSGTTNCAFALSGNESTNGTGYGIFMESPGGSNGLALRVSGNRVMNHEMDTSKPSVLSLSSAANSDVLDASFHVNGEAITSEQSSSSASLSTETLSGVILGGFSVKSATPNNAYDYNGIIYEALVFEDVLSSSERQHVEQYLSDKWSI
ncbi:fibronectin type III domain-containing protein [Pseudobacteriovorax antillogorgiicola]|uniref:fibronectin type III domain-containing protein n=1 Tax=Pseudobacteriovorax antillogorgiicola TaxID=1513793 RepID=UPI001356307E|nr:fibronectin type III domain-containing protein [Pseudobacteriovorax antillogorgiicola]